MKSPSQQLMSVSAEPLISGGYTLEEIAASDPGGVLSRANLVGPRLVGARARSKLISPGSLGRLCGERLGL